MATRIAELFPLRTFVRVVCMTCGPYRGGVGIVREHKENEIGVALAREAAWCADHQRRSICPVRLACTA